MRRQVAVTLLSVVVLGGACGQLRGDLEVEGIADVPEVPVSTAGRDGEAPDRPVVRVVADAPASEPFRFTAVGLDGAEVAGIDLYHRRSVLMTFLAPTCPLSVEEAPKIAASVGRHPEVTHVIVHSGGDRAAYEALVEQAGLDTGRVVHVDDTARELWERFGIDAHPATILVDRDGHLSRVTGSLGEDGLDRAAALVLEGGLPVPTIDR